MHNFIVTVEDPTTFKPSTVGPTKPLPQNKGTGKQEDPVSPPDKIIYTFLLGLVVIILILCSGTLLYHWNSRQRRAESKTNGVHW